MKTLSIDIETYSPVPIADCGSFRYIADPEFQILLFGYAFGENEPTVVDLLSGEEIPEDVVEAIYSPDYIKTGYNNAFERFALWRHFGRYCPPEQWEDTMVLAAVCGLPLGLDAVCTALGLGEDKAKNKAGKALIKYFCCPCKPTKVNGGRTRNYPEHAPEKWAEFIEYNRQDIVAERHIRNMLLHWKPDATEHRFWCLDARINEKGIRVDTTLVQRALEFDARYKEELTEKAIALSGLENPKSVSQIKVNGGYYVHVKVDIGINTRHIPEYITVPFLTVFAFNALDPFIFAAQVFPQPCAHYLFCLCIHSISFLPV